VGQHDWYKEGAERLLATQRADGSWGDLPATCLAMLFLQEGRTIPVFGKLSLPMDSGQDHPRALEYLAAYVRKRMQSEALTWQLMSIQMPLEELREVPILVIMPDRPLDLTAEDRKRLRAFTDAGGTILFAPDPKKTNITDSITNAIAQIWPEWPLAPLPEDHPIFPKPSIYLGPPPKLAGVDDEHRTVVFLTLDDVASTWEWNASFSRPSWFLVGVNMMNYATNRVRLYPRFAERPQPSPLAPAR
jgi:hypothetical protein